ncbi:glycoside hydrolase [Acaromyces ingoldii]|uniref:Glycoside hydrolase n=1 Tax=Acaromyces ingoldii TaxID=215250 RepID=A0A316YNT4_9BASI|nr:glycoside hydrolase [Acaromyces ingoldii]PWN89405.1 glycoside hydrolase [Acaromyces ingoldii]
MKKFIDKVQVKLDGSGGGTSASSAARNPITPRPPSTSEPSRRQLFLYRAQSGVNLGSLFSLEVWLTPSLFEGVKDAKSEHDLVRSLPADQAKQRLERHWKTFVDEGDWNWMKGQGINTVRLPISYFHYLAGHPDEAVRGLLKGTEYEAYAPIYAAAYGAIQDIVKTANRFDMGVLIDLHAAPGAQNADGHSGLSQGGPQFWTGSKAKWNQQRTVEILVAMARDFGRSENVVGLELLNEPQNSNRLQGWYDEALGAIRKESDASLPIYVGDGWDTNHYTGFTKRHNDSSSEGDGFVVVDHHLYRCFTKEHHDLTASQHAESLEGTNPTSTWLQRMSAQSNISIIIGEWSAALHHTSFKGQNKEEGQSRFATAQLRAFQRKCSGHFFWTLKKEGGPDRGWSLYSAVEATVLPKGGLQLSRPGGADASLAEKGTQLCKEKYQSHRTYWDSHGGKADEHWRYEKGFQQGWSDATFFYSRAGAPIGFRGPWAAMRTAAHASEKGGSHAWEYQHGMQQALEFFQRTIEA